MLRLLSILWAPTAFFERTASARPRRVLPPILASVVFGALSTAQLISERRSGAAFALLTMVAPPLIAIAWALLRT
jgi:hypothetical protein